MNIPNDPLNMFTKESWLKETQEDTLDFKNQEQESDSIDDDYERYLQDAFQYAIINDIFEDMVRYIGDQAIPVCEFFELDDVELLIDECF